MDLRLRRRHVTMQGRCDLSSAASGVGALQAQNAETMQALQERGEKLEQLNDKAAKMNDAAAEFQESTAALLRQQKSKQWF